jgi:hypothetical protein
VPGLAATDSLRVGSIARQRVVDADELEQLKAMAASLILPLR